jgi:hypothetical protein
MSIPTSVQTPTLPLYSGNLATLRVSQSAPVAGQSFSFATVAFALSSAAAAAATSLAVSALPGAIPGGALITLNSGNTYKVAPAGSASGATSIPLDPSTPVVSGGELSGATGVYDPAPLVPLASDLQASFLPKGASVNKNLYGQTDSISVKVGRDYQAVQVKTFGPASDPAIASLIAAAALTSPGCWRVIKKTNADGSAEIGTVNVNDFETMNPVRDAMERSFSLQGVQIGFYTP